MKNKCCTTTDRKVERNKSWGGCDTHAQWRVCVHSWAENDGDYPDAWRACARYGWRWPWKLTTLAGKSCLLWTIATCLGPRTFSDVEKSEWTRVETVNCNIQVWKSHVAYRDPDHTHTGLVLLKPPHTYTSTWRREVNEKIRYKKRNELLVSRYTFANYFDLLNMLLLCIRRWMCVYLLSACRCDWLAALFSHFQCAMIGIISIWFKRNRVGPEVHTSTSSDHRAAD